MTRTRVTNYVSPTETVSYVKEILSGGNVISSETRYSSQERIVSDKSMTDVVIPDFHKRRAKGEIFNNAMSSLEVRTEYSPPGYYFQSFLDLDSNNKVYGTRYSGMTNSRGWVNMAPNLAIPDASDLDDGLDALINRASAQAYGNISSSEAQAMMMAAEGRKTVASLGSILYRVLKIFKALKKYDTKFLKNEISRKELEARYMELRYAIRPLMYDAVSVHKAYNSSTYKNFRQTFRGKTSESVSNQDVYQTSYGTNVPYIGINRTASVTWTVRAGILTDVDASKLNIWGVDQIIETALEITPWSFIINWFINISDFICAWTPNIGIVNRASWYTVERVALQSKSIGELRTVDTHTHENEFLINGSVAISTTEKWRAPNLLKPTLPNINVNLDVLKLLDLTIILKNIRNGWKFRH